MGNQTTQDKSEESNEETKSAQHSSKPNASNDDDKSIVQKALSKIPQKIGLILKYLCLGSYFLHQSVFGLAFLLIQKLTHKDTIYCCWRNTEKKAKKDRDQEREKQDAARKENNKDPLQEWEPMPHFERGQHVRGGWGFKENNETGTEPILCECFLCPKDPTICCNSTEYAFLNCNSTKYGCWCPRFCYWIRTLSWILLVPAHCVVPICVVAIMNAVGPWTELQSWQLSYIIWGCSCSLCDLAFVFFPLDKYHQFCTLLLFPFGVKTGGAKGTSFWSVPLVSMAPAIVCGFLANFMFAPKFTMYCKNGPAGLPGHDEERCLGVSVGAACCNVISSHVEPLTFLSAMASTILAAWGVVKSIGFFICLYDDSLVVETEEMKTKRVVATFMKKDFAKFVESEDKTVMEVFRKATKPCIEEYLKHTSLSSSGSIEIVVSENSNHSHSSEPATERFEENGSI